MKLSVLFMFTALLSLHANNSYAQRTKITLDLENVSVARLLDEIESKTDFRFVYQTREVDLNRLISVKGVQEKVSSILDRIFNNTQTTYKVIDKQIFLRKSVKSNTDIHNSQSNSVNINNQQFTVSGTVTDAQGIPLSGANIIEKGTNHGVTADFDGNFIIEVANENSILEVSYIGFATKEVTVNGQTTFNIVLEESAAGLEEVVVVGYGTAKRSDLTGATSSISTNDIESQPSSRVDEVLQGRAPGLVVQNNSASPNGSMSIRIRGSNSINGSNDPLIVVDGFIGGDLSSINPNDISSIEVLKDASSTAIYGSRGANGVILVTTKSGRSSGKTKVELDSYVGLSSIRKKIDLLNAYQYAETVNARKLDLGLNTVFTDQEISEFRTNGGTDWQDEIYRAALQQSYQLSVSGGSDQLSYYMAGNYVDNEGIIKGSSYDRFSFRSNFTTKIGKNFSTGVNIYLYDSMDHPVLHNGRQDSAPVHAAEVYAPTIPVYNPDGSYTGPSSLYGPPQLSNPLALAVEPINDNRTINVTLNSFLEYKIIEGLTAKVIFGIRSVDQENSYYRNTKPENGAGDAKASIINSRFRVLQNTNQINYKKTLSDIHDLDITAVYEQQREDFNSSFAGSNGFSSDVFTYNNLALGMFPQIPESNRTRKDIQSLVGRVNYTLMNKYILGLTGRYDGASVFGEDHKWGFFPSAALAWRISEERFLQNITNLNDLKLRSSYGVTGSQAVKPYSSLAKFDSNLGYSINGNNYETGVGLGSLGNPDLRWEKTLQLDLGLDLAMFSNRFRFSFDYYNKLTKDLLLNIPLPYTSGYNSILRNTGEVENKGFEINIGGDPFSGDFSWSTSFNFAVNKNKVVSLAGGEDEITLGSPGFPNFGNTIFLDVGQPIGLLKGYIQDGIWGSDESTEAASYGAFPGAPKYIDQNGDGKISSEDIAEMGTALPKATYGWSNTFSYKGLDLNILIQGSEGNHLYNLTRVRTERPSSDSDATDIRILNRWTPDNQDTDVPSFMGSNSYERIQSSRWFEDASYLRFKNITLSYSLSKSLSDKLNINSAKIYVSGMNLITITDYSGYDPEASTNVDALGGIDNAPYPNQKTYTIGFNISL